MKGRVLIIDDDRQHAEVLSESMRAADYEVRLNAPGPSALEVVESFAPTAIVIDPSADGYDSFALLRELRIQQPHTPVILTARNSSVELALRAVQEEGAYHYFEKPVDKEKFLTVLEGATELSEARRENEILRRQLRDRGAFGELVGSSETMQQVYALIEEVASSSASVLITGEAGTG